MIRDIDIPDDAHAAGFRLPREIKELAVPEPWYLLDARALQAMYRTINARYPNRKVVPFARRRDTDDVATFVVHDPDYEQGMVLIVHDYSSPGFEVEGSFPTLGEWLVAAAQEAT